MSAVANKSWAGAERPGGDRKQKVILIALSVVFVALAAYQGPKILDRGGAKVVEAPLVTPVVATEVPAGPAAEAEATPGTVVAPAATAKPSAAALAFRKLPRRDPFAPQAGNEPAAPAAPSVGPTSPAPSAPVETAPPTISVPVTPAEPVTPVTPETPVVGPVFVPTAAVIFTNGNRKVIGEEQTFKVGDTVFKLVAVTKKTVKIAAIDGVFANGKRTLTISRGQTITLENTATGVQYELRFALPTTDAPTEVPVVAESGS